MANDVQVVSPATAPVVTASSAYSSGQGVGGLLQFDASNFRDPQGGVIDHAILTDAAKQSANMDLVLFSANPSASTVTDKTTIAIAAADLAKIIGVVPITTHAVFNATSVSYGQKPSIPFSLAPGGTVGKSQIIYGVLVARATPTYAATTDVGLTIGMRRP